MPVFNERVICGLGRGIAKTGRLDKEGVALAETNLLRFTRLAEAMAVRSLELVATAAVREADNGPDFIGRVTELTGYPVTVLDGAQEAQLAALGVVAGVPEADGIVGDLGGGSLELVEVSKGALGRSLSLPLGPLRLMDQDEGDKVKLRARIVDSLKEVPWLDSMTGRAFYAVGGAWRNIARLHMEQTNYPLHVIHNYQLNAVEVVGVAGVISQQGRRSLAKMSSVSRRRLDTLPFAALVLGALVGSGRPEKVVFSAFGLREGLFYERLPKKQQGQDPLLVAARDIERRNGRFPGFGPALADWMAPLIARHLSLPRRLMEAACLLSDTAWRSHPDYRAEEAMEQVLYSPLVAVTHAERAFIGLALYIRYGGNGEDDEVAVPRQLLSDSAAQQARRLGLAMRLANAISGGTRDLLLKTSLVVENDDLRLVLPEDGSVPAGEVLDRRLQALASAMSVNGTLIANEDDGGD